MPRTVLVVDDSGLIRTQLRRALEAANFSVVEAEDGEQAWDVLTGSLPPHAMILDVHMPKLTGPQLLEKMHDELPRAHVPVMMLTTDGQPDLMSQARGHGVKGWFIKPFKAELVVAAITKLLSNA